LEGALDKGWEILADCFTPEETGLRSELTKAFWPREADVAEQSRE
jgi:V/A-type H+-transporting ATPase subunit B